MSADKACQTIMCLGGNSEPDPYPDLSSFNSDFMYQSDVALSDCSENMLPFPPVTENSEANLPADSAACEALADCFNQKLAAANEKGSNPRPSSDKSISGSNSLSTESLPSRFTVDSGSVS